MIDPKQGLTRFSQIYTAKERVNARSRAGAAALEADAYRDLATAELFAAEDALHESDANVLSDLKRSFSVSAVEEVIGLARVQEREGQTFLEDAGVTRDLLDRLTTAFEHSAASAEEKADWERFEALDYALGMEIDLTTPPSDVDNDLGAAALGGPTAGGPALPVGAAAPPPVAGVNLIDGFMPSIRDQADRGTCVAFTAMSCLEYHHRRFGAIEGVDLSEQFAYWNMVAKTGHRNLVAMFPLLVKDGACREGKWPYYPKPIPGNDPQGPPPPDATAEAKAFRCGAVLQLPPRSVDALQQALRQSRVVGIGIPVYNSWFKSPIVRKYGNITVPFPGEIPQQIGHAVNLVGYEDDQDYAGGGYFIVRNSWNGYWATDSVFGGGYGTIPYKYIRDLNWDAWCIVK